MKYGEYIKEILNQEPDAETVSTSQVIKKNKQIKYERKKDLTKIVADLIKEIEKIKKNWIQKKWQKRKLKKIMNKRCQQNKTIRFGSRAEI